MKQNEKTINFYEDDQLAALRSRIHALNRTRKKQQKLLEELVNTKASLEKTIQDNHDFMSIAGHEINNPLMVLRLRLESRRKKLAAGQLQNVNHKFLEQMFDSDNSQLNLLASHVDDLVCISRSKSGTFTLKLEPFNICQLVREVVEKNQALAKDANVEFHIHAPKEIWGKWDKLRIEQVVTNLLTNAIRYGNGNPVTIELKTDDSKALIVFKDNGIGISQTNLERIFQKYEQVGEIKTHGLGLGLYIVKQIIDAHKGAVNVVSQKGVGSSFRVELPFRS
jgi:signal transduction histidine kinase